MGVTSLFGVVPRLSGSFLVGSASARSDLAEVALWANERTLWLMRPCQDCLSGPVIAAFQGEYARYRVAFVCWCVCVWVAWWLKKIRWDSEFCDELLCSSRGSVAACGHWKLEEWMCARGQTASLSSACFSLLIYRAVVSLSRPLSRFSALFYSCDSPRLQLPLPLHSPAALSIQPSVSLALFFSSPIALVLLSSSTKECWLWWWRCGRGAHWFFLQRNVKVCKAACKCQRECAWLSELLSWVCLVFVQSCWLGRALWPQSLGDQEVEVWGWMVSSITSLSNTTTVTADTE